MKGEEGRFVLPGNSRGMVVAVRFWRGCVVPSPIGYKRIKSVTAPMHWKINKAMEAMVPLRKKFNIPSANGYSGIFGCKVGAFLFNKTHLLGNLRRDFIIFGLVALWGEVIEHEEGYRAQFGYPLSLSDKGLADDYGVETFLVPEIPTEEFLDSLQDYALHIARKMEAVNLKVLEERKTKRDCGAFSKFPILAISGYNSSRFPAKGPPSFTYIKKYIIGDET